jgi:hypothetical protein
MVEFKVVRSLVIVICIRCDPFTPGFDRCPSGNAFHSTCGCQISINTFDHFITESNSLISSAMYRDDLHAIETSLAASCPGISVCHSGRARPGLGAPSASNFDDAEGRISICITDLQRHINRTSNFKTLITKPEKPDHKQIYLKSAGWFSGKAAVCFRNNR